MGSKTRHTRVEPKFREIEKLREFTNGFANELGAGAYGTVFKGIDDKGNDIAVKVLKERPDSSEEKDYKREFESLLKLSHPNIIQLVGYSYQPDENYDDVLKMSEPIIRTALCFEYAAEGNLGKHMSDNGDKLDWLTCYKIIKGTCEGLCYLHNHPSGSFWHLDLKPENILLHHNMVPKIADFGMSKLISDQTSKSTVNPFGTWKYVPNEYKIKRTISKEFDIYSLGVIILEIVVGTKTFEDTDGFSEQDADLAFEKWKPKLSPMYYEQVKTCLRIALKCMVNDRHKRPKIQNIIDELNMVENMTPTVPVSLGQNSNLGSSEILKDYGRWHRKDNTGQTSQVVNKDKDRRRHTEMQLYGSSSHTRRGGDEIILYITTMGSISKTFNECNTIRAALKSQNVAFTEKDLFNEPDNLNELKQLLVGSPYKLPVPVLSIDGMPVGDAMKLLKLHSEGRLQELFK